ncbi:MAG TPA: hypothetical protein VIE65_09055 [Methylobacter sp.]|jgi:hypothetical protein
MQSEITLLQRPRIKEVGRNKSVRVVARTDVAYMDVGKGREQERKLFRQTPPNSPETPPRATRLDGLIPAYIQA